MIAPRHGKPACGVGVVAGFLVAAAWPAPPAAAAESSRDLLRIPVAGTAPVAVEAYGEASTVARRGGTPLEIALAVAGPFEGRAQILHQANERAEAPAACRVTVLRDGLLDDSIRGERWDLALRKASDGTWRIDAVRRSWMCRRGQPKERFVATKCP